MRLMILLALTTADPATPIGDIQIGVDVVKAVLALCDYQLEARRECDPVDAENAVARCEEVIRRRVKKEPRALRELKRACHVERVGIWVFNTAMQHLKVRMRSAITSARGSTRAKVSPFLSPHFWGRIESCRNNGMFSRVG